MKELFIYFKKIWYSGYFSEDKIKENQTLCLTFLKLEHISKVTDYEDSGMKMDTS